MRLALADDRDSIAEICSMLENETRLEILLLLSREDMSLNQLFQRCDISNHRSGLHRHLQKLRDAGLIEKYLNQKTDQKTYRLVEEKVEIELEDV